MPNLKHLKILKRGVKEWNDWKKTNPLVSPMLQRMKLGGMNLSGIHLSLANLISTDLSGADLSGAYLSGANLSGANLSHADLRGANLIGAVLHYTDITNANLSDAEIGHTFFAGIDFRTAAGLESIFHRMNSTIGIDSIYRSEGLIPVVFLRGCGVPENFITYMGSLVSQPIQFYSCFISYSSKDHPFAERLYADLQNKGVRCWFAPEDLNIGEKIRPTIDESIRLHDKLLLVLSRTSVNSQWVEHEVETALAKEREQKRTILFPIRIDNSVMKIKSGWPSLIKNSRNIGDFTKWKEHEAFQKEFTRLLRALKVQGGDISLTASD